jgi:hypothetical protein
MSAHTRRDGPGCRSTGRSVVAAIRSATRTGLHVRSKRRCPASPAQAGAQARVARPPPGKSCPGAAGRRRSGAAGTSPPAVSLAEHRVEFGVGPDLPDLLRAAAADGDLGSPRQRLLARGHVDERESADGLRVRAAGDRPSVATMLAGWFSSPPADTYTPALMASWTAARAALATAGASSSGMWSIAWAPNEIRYCVIHDSVVPAACSGRALTHRRTTRPGSIALPEEISHESPPAGPRERHVTRARGDHRRCRRLRAVQPHSSNAATAASARPCRRAEPGHPLTRAVPWQTKRQPRIFGLRRAPRCELPGGIDERP